MNITLPESLKIKLLWFGITFNTKGTSIDYWLPMILIAGVINFILWPFIIIYCINQIGGNQFQLPYHFDTWFGFALLIASLPHLIPTSKK